MNTQQSRILSDEGVCIAET